MMPDQEIRFECLRLALDSTDDTEGAIELARQYEAFVIGDAEGAADAGLAEAIRALRAEMVVFRADVERPR